MSDWERPFDDKDVDAIRQALLKELHEMGLQEIPIRLILDQPYYAMLHALRARRS